MIDAFGVFGCYEVAYGFVCFALEPSDEVGFVHPSQFVNLSEEAPSSSGSVSNVVCLKDGTAVFWNREHKLGISTDVLIPLYKEAKRAMMAAIQQYKGLYSAFDVSGVESSVSLDDSIEGEVMKQSRAVLLVSSDYGTAWNSRYFPLYIIGLQSFFSVCTSLQIMLSLLARE